MGWKDAPEVTSATPAWASAPEVTDAPPAAAASAPPAPPAATAPASAPAPAATAPAPASAPAPAPTAAASAPTAAAAKPFTQDELLAQAGSVWDSVSSATGNALRSMYNGALKYELGDVPADAQAVAPPPPAAPAAAPRPGGVTLAAATAPAAAAAASAASAPPAPAPAPAPAQAPGLINKPLFDYASAAKQDGKLNNAVYWTKDGRLLYNPTGTAGTGGNDILLGSPKTEAEVNKLVNKYQKDHPNAVMARYDSPPQPGSADYLNEEAENPDAVPEVKRSDTAGMKQEAKSVPAKVIPTASEFFDRVLADPFNRRENLNAAEAGNSRGSRAPDTQKVLDDYNAKKAAKKAKRIEENARIVDRVQKRNQPPEPPPAPAPEPPAPAASAPVANSTPVRERIAKSESGEASYDAMFGFSESGGDPRIAQNYGGRTLSELTIREVLDLSRDRSAENRAAAGRYQFMPATLAGAVQSAGLSLSDVFDKTNQDKLYAVVSKKNDAALRGFGLTVTDSLRRVAWVVGAGGVEKLVDKDNAQKNAAAVLNLSKKQADTNPLLRDNSAAEVLAYYGVRLPQD